MAMSPGVQVPFPKQNTTTSYPKTRPDSRLLQPVCRDQLHFHRLAVYGGQLDDLSIVFQALFKGHQRLSGDQGVLAESVIRLFVFDASRGGVIMPQYTRSLVIGGNLFFVRPIGKIRVRTSRMLGQLLPDGSISAGASQGVRICTRCASERTAMVMIIDEMDHFVPDAAATRGLHQTNLTLFGGGVEQQHVMIAT